MTPTAKAPAEMFKPHDTAVERGAHHAVFDGQLGLGGFQFGLQGGDVLHREFGRGNLRLRRRHRSNGGVSGVSGLFHCAGGCIFLFEQRLDAAQRVLRLDARSLRLGEHGLGCQHARFLCGNRPLDVDDFTGNRIAICVGHTHGKFVRLGVDFEE
jgi:hypothetical protein